MDLLFYLRVVRKGWWLILLCTLLSTAAAVLTTSRATPVYQATTKLYISGQPASDAQSALANGMLSEQRIASYADLVTSSPVVDEVFRALGQPQGAASVAAAPLANTLILIVTVKDSDAERAARVANEFGRVVPEVIERTEQPASGAPSPVQASVSQPAFTPSDPVSPKPKLNTLLGVVLGLLVGGAFALLKETLDTSIKSIGDLERAAPGLSLLGSVFFDSDGENNHLVTATQPRSPGAEAFRQLRTNVQFAKIDSQLRSFVVTSALPNEGKSTVSANIAIALAQSGQRVILVEADLRRPSLAEYMGFERAVGLTDVLIGRVDLDDALQEFGAERRLSILPAGPVPPNPSEILGSQAMHDLLRTLESKADTVILDTPPLLPVTDAAVLAGQTTGALLVVRTNKTTREQVRRALRALDGVGATAIGAALNFVRGQEAGGYGYGYGLDYGYAPAADLPVLDGPAPDVVPARLPGRSDPASVRSNQAAEPDRQPSLALAGGPLKAAETGRDAPAASEQQDTREAQRSRSVQ